jgi:N-acetyl-gamma-glutamyl-phosphate reductase
VTSVVGRVAPVAPVAAAPVPQRRIAAGILGVSGYGGLELVRLLGMHPYAQIVAAASRQYAGQPLGNTSGALGDAGLVLDADLLDPTPWVERGVEIVFAALPHGALAARARRFLDAGLKIVDLSADFRLRDPAEYERRYGLVHPDPELLSRAVYGLSEWSGDAVHGATLVANPGCYATAVLLATLPALAAGLWNGAPLVANALSGVSGAGRSPALATHFVECGQGASPYKVGEDHAHLGEVQQALRRVLGGATSVALGSTEHAGELPLAFNPHLVPMSRGIVANVAIPLAEAATLESLQTLYRERYAGAPCVRVLDGAALPETRNVRGSNRCDIAVRVVAQGRLLLAFAAIDNLGKGAAGQAIQNWNRMRGWPEQTGLPLEGWSIG